MKYIDVTWHHNNDAYPTRLVSELDSSRYEIRKLEFYINGNVGYASERKSHLGSVLGEKPVPTLEEVNGDPEFTGKYICAQEFELLWNEYVSNST